MDTLALLLLAILPGMVIVAALSDVTSMTIPNWISAVLVVGFFPTALIVGLDLASVATHVGVAVVALVVVMGLFALGWLGGGDAKLIAAVALWMGVSGAGLFVLWIAVAGGVLSLMLMIMRACLAPMAAGAPGWVGQLLTPRGDIPYGVAIAAGALMAFPSSRLLSVFMAQG